MVGEIYKANTNTSNATLNMDLCITIFSYSDDWTHSMHVE